MRYNMKYWDEHAIERSHGYDIHLFDLPDGAGNMIRIAVVPNTGYTRRYYSVDVNGVTVATRCKASNTIRAALDYLNNGGRG